LRTIDFRFSHYLENERKKIPKETEKVAWRSKFSPKELAAKASRGVVLI
jgi:hypothetical protein